MYIEKKTGLKFESFDSKEGLIVSRFACDKKCPMFCAGVCKETCIGQKIHAANFENMKSFSAFNEKISIQTQSGIGNYVFEKVS